MTSLGSVLIVEDDLALRLSLKSTLESAGFRPYGAPSGEEALDALRTNDFETVLLDINMPGIGGIETCRRIRRTHPLLPIVMLTVRDQEGDKVEALDAGADDYITKPFGVEELLARMRAAVRRTGTAADLPRIKLGDLIVDLAAKRVTRQAAVPAGGHAAQPDDIRLTPTEWHLLEVLLRHPGKLLSRNQLLTEVWGPGYADATGNLRLYMAQLRRKLEPDPARPRWLITEPGMGYRYQPGPDEDD